MPPRGLAAVQNSQKIILSYPNTGFSLGSIPDCSPMPSAKFPFQTCKIRYTVAKIRYTVAKIARSGAKKPPQNDLRRLRLLFFDFCKRQGAFAGFF